MADPRIIDIKLDEHTIIWRSADIEQERRIAIFDILEGNHFAPQRVHADGYAGPYRLSLRVKEGRLVLDVLREDATPLESVILALGRFRRLPGLPVLRLSAHHVRFESSRQPEPKPS